MFVDFWVSEMQHPQALRALGVGHGGTVLCESETGIVLPAQAGGLTLRKQYKYGRVLLWKYTKLMQNADPIDHEQEGEAL